MGTLVNTTLPFAGVVDVDTSSWLKIEYRLGRSTDELRYVGRGWKGGDRQGRI